MLRGKNTNHKIHVSTEKVNLRFQLMIKRHLNDRKQKGLEDETTVADTEAADENVSCSSDSESDDGEKEDYAKCKLF